MAVDIQTQLRQLPSIDALLSGMPEELARWGHTQLTGGLRDCLSALRSEITAGNAPDISPDSIRASVVAALDERGVAHCRPPGAAIARLAWTGG